MFPVMLSVIEMVMELITSDPRQIHQSQARGEVDSIQSKENSKDDEAEKNHREFLVPEMSPRWFKHIIVNEVRSQQD